MMAETCLLAEAAICYPPMYDELRNVTARPTETVETVALAAVAAAPEQGASAILVLSTSGTRPVLSPSIAQMYPLLPVNIRSLSFVLTVDIFLVTRNEQTARQIHLHRGVYPLWYSEPRGIASHQWQTDVCGLVLILIGFQLRSWL